MDFSSWYILMCQTSQLYSVIRLSQCCLSNRRSSQFLQVAIGDVVTAPVGHSIKLDAVREFHSSGWRIFISKELAQMAFFVLRRGKLMSSLNLVDFSMWQLSQLYFYFFSFCFFRFETNRSHESTHASQMGFFFQGSLGYRFKCGGACIIYWSCLQACSSWRDLPRNTPSSTRELES